MPAPDFAAYVGLPCKDNGRDRSGLDCWGLVRLVFAEQAGIILPSYSDLYVTTEDSEAIADLIAHRMEPWREIDERAVRPLDGVMMRFGKSECHMGLVVRRGFVLHTGLMIGASRIERYDAIKLRRRVTRFLRHEALDERDRSQDLRG
jgi:cell wall-associated NlpC family hydrolase